MYNHVGGNLDAIHEAHTGDLTKSGVRLLGGGGEDTGANAALLRVVLECRVLGLALDRGAALTDKLVDSRQSFSPSYLSRPVLITYLKATQHDVTPDWRK